MLNFFTPKALLIPAQGNALGKGHGKVLETL